MTRRLAIAIASHIERFGEWPTDVRLSAEALYWIARTLDAEHFEHLAGRMKLRVTKHAVIAVGSSRGHLTYPPAEPADFTIVDRVERELGLDEVILDPPSPTLVDLMASLFGQEVFHQLVLQELLSASDLGQRLGIWTYTQPPSVVYEPRRGLFDLALAQFKGGADAPIEVYLELKFGSHLEPAQFARQAAAAGGVRRVYVLLGSTYFRWRHATGATFIGMTQMADAVGALGAEYGGSTGELARVYGERLKIEATRWTDAMNPHGDWDALDFFRFYAEIAPTWPVPVDIYPVINRGGPQYVLNPPSGWKRPSLMGWGDAQVYWELVDGRLRYKVMWDGARELRVDRRAAWRRALFTAAAATGEKLRQPRSASGRSMTAAELASDIRVDLIRDGQLDPIASRSLYDRASRLFDAAIAALERSGE